MARLSRSTVPQFGCHGCGRTFTRIVGTPMARLTRKDALPGFVRLLSQQRPVADAVRHLGLDERIVSNWVKKFRTWLLQLDPSGAYERMVKLGVKRPAPVLYCPHCCEEREMAYFGYVTGHTHLPYAQRTRQFRCQTCRRYVRLAGVAHRAGGDGPSAAVNTEWNT